MRLFLLALNPTDSVTEGFLPAAARLGLDVTLLTEPGHAPAHHAAYPAAAAPEIRDCAVRDFHEVVGEIARLSRPGEEFAVFSNSDHLQTQTALAAAYFGLPGKDWRAALRTKNKAQTRRHLAAHGADTVRSAELPPAADPLAPPADGTPVRYPCVVKPREGVAGEHVVLAADPAELSARVAEIRRARPGQALVVEEFLPGELHTLETLGDAHGTRHVLGGFRTELSPPPYFVEQRLIFEPPPPQTPPKPTTPTPPTSGAGTAAGSSPAPARGTAAGSGADADTASCVTFAGAVPAPPPGSAPTTPPAPARVAAPDPDPAPAPVAGQPSARPDIPQVLAQLDTLGVGLGACHTEYVVGEDGRARIVEVNYRAIGDQCDLMLADLLRIPLFEHILRVHLGERLPSDLGARRGGRARQEAVCADRSGTLTAAPAPAELTVDGVRLTYRPLRAVGERHELYHTNRDYLGVLRAVGAGQAAVDRAVTGFLAAHRWEITP